MDLALSHTHTGTYEYTYAHTCTHTNDAAEVGVLPGGRQKNAAARMLQSMPLLSHQLLSFTVFCTSLVSSIIMDSFSASSPPRLLWRPPSVSSSSPDLRLLHAVASSGLSSVLEPAPISLPDTFPASLLQSGKSTGCQ